MKKPCEQTVSGEALSQKRFEEEIRKHAKSGTTICTMCWKDFDKSNPFMKTTKEEKESALRDYNEWITTEWVPLKVVLGVVAKTEAERQKQLKEWFTEIPLAENCVEPHEEVTALHLHIERLRKIVLNSKEAQQP